MEGQPSEFRKGKEKAKVVICLMNDTEKFYIFKRKNEANSFQDITRRISHRRETKIVS